MFRVKWQVSRWARRFQYQILRVHNASGSIEKWELKTQRRNTWTTIKTIDWKCESRIELGIVPLNKNIERWKWDSHYIEC